MGAWVGTFVSGYCGILCKLIGALLQVIWPICSIADIIRVTCLYKTLFSAKGASFYIMNESQPYIYGILNRML